MVQISIRRFSSEIFPSWIFSLSWTKIHGVVVKENSALRHCGSPKFQLLHLYWEQHGKVVQVDTIHLVQSLGLLLYSKLEFPMHYFVCRTGEIPPSYCSIPDLWLKIGQLKWPPLVQFRWSHDVHPMLFLPDARTIGGLFILGSDWWAVAELLRVVRRTNKRGLF